MRLWPILLALLNTSALADGSARLSPLGVPWVDTVTLTCQSGRHILFFAENTQSLRLFYRGKLEFLITVYLPESKVIRYSNKGLSTMGDFGKNETGIGLEWRSTARSGNAWDRSELYRVIQQPNGKRESTLIERCRA